MDIKILTDFEKQSIGERQPLPERFLRLSDDELDARIAIGAEPKRASAWSASDHAGIPTALILAWSASARGLL